MYHLSVFIHILSAIFWIGGMLFTAAVLVPVSRSKLLNNKRGAFFTLVGRKFSRISWALFLILIVTGITNLLTRGYTVENLTTAAFWNSYFGETLSIKLHLFAAVLIISGTHDFYAGPKAAELMDRRPESAKNPADKKGIKLVGAY
jgi:uncharacterized membrane protein